MGSYKEIGGVLKFKPNYQGKTFQRLGQTNLGKI